MNDICKKCGKEYTQWRSFFIKGQSLCFKCEEKEDRKTMWLYVGLTAFVFLSVFGLRILWAKYVYNDYRCALSECRILKN